MGAQRLQDGEVTAALGETCDDGNTLTETCAYGEACVICDGTCQEVPGVYAFVVTVS